MLYTGDAGELDQVGSEGGREGGRELVVLYPLPTISPLLLPSLPPSFHPGLCRCLRRISYMNDSERGFHTHVSLPPSVPPPPQK